MSQGHPSPKQQGLPFPGSPAHTVLSSLPPFKQEEPRQKAADDTPCDHKLLTLTPLPAACRLCELPQPLRTGGQVPGQWGPCTCGLSEVPLTSLLPSSRPDSAPAHSRPGPYSPSPGWMGAPHSTNGSSSTAWSSLSSPQPRQTGSRSRGQAETPPPGRGPARLRLHPWSRLTCGRRGPELKSWPGASGRSCLSAECSQAGAAPALRGSGPFALPAGLGPAQVTSGAQRSAPGPAGRALESCSSTVGRHAPGAQAAHL